MRKQQKASLLFFWDYDTQWGADRSRTRGGPKTWGSLEFENTERLLELHAEYDAPACFAVVGAAALPGERPYHDPGQIRRIHADGHEVGSHGFKHEWLPALGPIALRETLVQSRDALEQCIGSPVSAFVPPFNQPFDYPGGLSFSLSERLSVRDDRTDLRQLCSALRETGYAFCRVAYRSIPARLIEGVRGMPWLRSSRLETVEGIACARLNTPGGFTSELLNMIESRLGSGGLWILYGHPHSVSEPASSQSLENLRGCLERIARWRREGLIRCMLPREILMENESES
jgi:peptidoglycan/xylan/chitin deacetylase (PgdA/CDA1 family)